MTNYDRKLNFPLFLCVLFNHIIYLSHMEHAEWHQIQNIIQYGCGGKVRTQLCARLSQRHFFFLPNKGKTTSKELPRLSAKMSLSTCLYPRPLICLHLPSASLTLLLLCFAMTAHPRGREPFLVCGEDGDKKTERERARGRQNCLCVCV